MADDQLTPGITGGVDTHKDVHVGAALDELGRLQGTRSFPTTVRGYGAMLAWFASFGPVLEVGIEGTGSYGAGLARHMSAAGVAVIEVSRPNRQKRRLQGKSDTVDAISAARAVQSGEATGLPKSGDGQIEAIRLLRVARRGAIKARTQAGVQLQNLVGTAPEGLRAELGSMCTKAMVARCARMRPGPPTNPTDAAKRAMVSVSRRWLAVDAEVSVLDADLGPLVTAAAPRLLALPGVGPETAGVLLVAAGDNPARLHSDAAFAKICGVAPLPASSGKTVRHRLNQGGNREANSALWRIVLVRLATHQPSKDYMARRTNEGLSKRKSCAA